VQGVNVLGLVSIGTRGELIYRSALAFTSELGLRGSDAADPAARVVTGLGPVVAGPIEAVWRQGAETRTVAVTNPCPPADATW
jgi:hypothetical protein